MKLKDWLFKQSLFWSKHLYIVKAVISIACIIPIIDLDKIVGMYIQMFKVLNSIARTLVIPIAIITVIISLVYAVVYIKENET